MCIQPNSTFKHLYSRLCLVFRYFGPVYHCKLNVYSPFLDFSRLVSASFSPSDKMRLTRYPCREMMKRV
uniref:Uncharacterized protein n=1 Tax=Solanum tuberosum TaxID=4113 RepID=M1C8L7_SOLTU